MEFGLTSTMERYRLPFPPVNNNCLWTIRHLHEALIRLGTEYEALRHHYRTLIIQRKKRFPANIKEQSKAAELRTKHLEEKMVQLEGQYQYLQRNHKETETLVVELDKQLGRTQRENIDCTAQIGEYRELNFKLQKQIKELKAELLKERRVNKIQFESLNLKEKEILHSEHKMIALEEKHAKSIFEKQACIAQLEKQVGRLETRIRESGDVPRAVIVEKKTQGDQGVSSKEASTTEALVKDLREHGAKLQSNLEQLEKELQMKENVILKLEKDNSKLREQFQRNQEKSVLGHFDSEEQLYGKEKDHTKSKAEAEKEMNRMQKQLSDMEEKHKKIVENLTKKGDLLENRLKETDHALKTSKEEGKSLQNQLDRIKEANEGLKKELTQRLSELWQVLYDNRKLEEQIKTLGYQRSTDLDGREQLQMKVTQELEGERRRSETLEAQLKQLKKECRQLAEKHRTAKAEAEDLSRRLSEEMNDKISKDERNVENVSIANRPMNVANDYQLICSNQWLDAKTTVDEMLPEASEARKLEFLCRIYLLSLKSSTSNLQVLLTRLHNYVFNPFGTGSETQTEMVKASGSVIEKLESTFLDLLRINVDNTDISTIVQSVKQGVSLDWPEFRSLLKQKSIQTFIRDVSQLAWKMAIQKPAMQFHLPGIGLPWKGEATQILHFGSIDPKTPGAKVKCYVQPMLVHGDSLMVKGTVFLKI